MAIDTSRIFTAQGWLDDALENPGLDLLMNMFRIPRVFAVGGFDGTWNVGKHSYLVGLLSIMWGKFNGWKPVKRDALVTMAITHDIHESVTGDVLPQIKVPEVKTELNRIQDVILDKLGIRTDKTLEADLKFLDLLAFLYEVKCAPVQVLNSRQPGLHDQMMKEQRNNCLEHCAKHGISKEKAVQFMKMLELY